MLKRPPMSSQAVRDLLLPGVLSAAGRSGREVDCWIDELGNVVLDIFGENGIEHRILASRGEIISEQLAAVVPGRLAEWLHGQQRNLGGDAVSGRYIRPTRESRAFFEASASS